MGRAVYWGLTQPPAVLGRLERSVASNRSPAAGAAGQASSKAAGGLWWQLWQSSAVWSHAFVRVGWRWPSGFRLLIYGSTNAPVTVSAAAGATVSQLINKPSGAQSVKLFVGTGGTGGQGFSQFIGGNGNRSRSKCRAQEATAVMALYQWQIPTQAASKSIYFQSLTDLQQQVFN